MTITTRTKTPEIFARKREDGNFDILDYETCEQITFMDVNVYPVNSNFSARYIHPDGIILSQDDVEELGLHIE